MTPYKDLIYRLDSLSKIKTRAEILQEAGVIRENLRHWEQKESEMIIRWFNMLTSVNVDPLNLKPLTFTYVLLYKALERKHNNVTRHFIANGYSASAPSFWKQGDPRQVESFKRVNSIVRKYERILQRQESML